MRTVEQTYYNFNELSNEVQNKVIEKAQSDFKFIDTYEFWAEDSIENFIQELTENGFHNAKIYYSGFSSQGNGLCFDSDIDLAFFCETIQEKRIAKLIENDEIVKFIIEKNSYSNHYSDEKTRYVSYWQTDYTNIDKVLESLCKKIENSRLEFCYKFYKDLESDYDYCNSDEFIRSEFIEREYEFEIDGTIV